MTKKLRSDSAPQNFYKQSLSSSERCPEFFEVLVRSITCIMEDVYSMASRAGISGEITEVEKGDILDTYKVSSDPVLYLQSSSEHQEALERGASTLRSLQDSGIPVPEIKYFEPEESAVVTYEVEGENLDEANNPEKAFYDVGKTLGLVHKSFSFGDYGPIIHSKEGMVSESYDNWRDAVKTLHRYKMASANDILGMERDHDIEEVFYETIDAVPEYPESRMLHFDFRPSNIIVKEEAVNAVLDWDRAFAGHPDFEYVRARRELEREFGDSNGFEQGYRSIREPNLNEVLEDFYNLEAEIFHTSALQFLENIDARELTEEDVEQQRENIDELLEPFR